MNRVVAGVVALMAAVGSHAGQVDPNAWTRSAMFVTAAVDVDAEGKIQHMELLPFKDSRGKDLAPALRALAESTMSKWEFVPAMLNDHPAPAHTFVHAVFEFRAHGDDFDARVVSVGNGPRLIRTGVPQYPLDMVHAGVQANLSMLALVQPDGRLTDMKLESAQTTGRHPAAEFVRSAKNAMASWRAQPETVDGHPIKTWISVPFSYDIRDTPNGQQYSPVLEPASDSPAAPKQMDTGSEAVALDSPLKLRPASP